MPLSNFTLTPITVNVLECNCCSQQVVQQVMIPQGTLYVCKNCGQSEIVLRTGQDIAVPGNPLNSITAIQASPSNPQPVTG